MPAVTSEEYYELGPGKLVVKNEYIVGIKSWWRRVAPSQNALEYQYYPETVLRVKNGTVRDPNNIFRQGVEVSVGEFISRLRDEVVNIVRN